jgi:hypothetical protein
MGFERYSQPSFLVGFALFASILPLPNQAGAQQDAKVNRNFKISRTSTKIEIDGRLTESAWENAEIIDLPYEYFPGENVTPPVRTEALVTYDDRYFYVGFRAFDPEPEKIRAHLMDRDQVRTLQQDDTVGFLLDTFNDQRRGYYFLVNPLGVQAEAIVTLSDEDWAWDMIWESFGRITAEGYTVEIAVPFHQLRFPSSGTEHTFGFAAARTWPRNVKHEIQSFYLDFGDSCWICQFNKISGFEAISPGHNIEIDPTLTSSRTDERESYPEGELERGEIELEPGLTARWGVTPSITASGTINPDFSQVEADTAQLEVNERFALFFPEKRPFFLEGEDYFRTPNRAIFTRTVANPAWGVKLTGKIGDNVLGASVTRDRMNNLVIPSNQFSDYESIDQEVTGSVFRYRRDLGRSSTVGVLGTSREADDYHNRLVGIDGFVQVAGADTLEFQVLHTHTLYPNGIAERHHQIADGFAGTGLFARYNHGTRNWGWSVSYEDFSPGFRADFGFIPRVDYRHVLAWVSRTWWGDANRWWTSFDIGPGFARTVSHNGVLLNQNIGIEGALQGPLQSKLYFYISDDKETFNNVTFDLNQRLVKFEIQPTGSMKIRLDGEWGNRIDSFNTQKGDAVSFRPGIELKIGTHVNFLFSHAYQRLNIDRGRLYQENLTEARLFYHFDVRTLVRLIVQYRSIDRNPTLFPTPVPPHDSRLNLQFLASYKLNPRTVFLVGYSDQHRGLHDLPLTQTNRTFFVKLGYAWTF